MSHCNPWSVACWAPLSMEFSRQEYYSRLPFSSPGDLPDLGIKPRSPALQADSLPSKPPGNFRLYEGHCKLLHPELLSGDVEGQ